MTLLASSPILVVEDLFLSLTYPLRERGKALTDLVRGVGQADLGPFEEIQEAAPAVDEGRELRRREALGTTEEELLNEDVQGRRHARRAYPEAAEPTNKPRSAREPWHGTAHRPLQASTTGVPYLFLP